MPLNATEFDFIRKLVKEQSAIVLENGKEYLVEARLHPLLQKEGLASFEELVSHLRSNKRNGLDKKIIEAMTTNETSFFRDLNPFETLKKTILPDIKEKRSATKELNIWCGASSSGQEPYTLAFVLKEFFPDPTPWKINFTASDISVEMLERCRNGIYSQLEINRGLPAPMLIKYFERCGVDWQIKEPIRKMIQFRELNLCSYWPIMPKMDIIFLRNVLIYFDVETKKEIFSKIRKLLKPDGYLFLGAAETTLNLDDNFARIDTSQCGCYQIKNAS